ncbi:MAG: mandelate racemase/muconate lactonizing enzyme family protein [Lysobacterales bacterium]
MKLIGVTATALASRAAHPAAPALVTGGWCLLELATDQGLMGRALCPAPARDAALGLANALLIGEDPRAVSTLWDRMSGQPGGVGVAPARASLDHACWDLKAQANGEPLWKTMGGSRPRAPVYASLRGAAATDEAVNDWFGRVAAQHSLQSGLLCLCGDPQTDARRLGLLRGILERQGKPVELAADAGGIWPDEAVRDIREIECSVDLAWIKGVAARGDFLGCRRVADRVRAAVCVGGDLSRERDFLPWFHHRAGNVIELDIHRLGITGALRVAEAAFGFELPVTLAAAPGNIQVHLAAVMPNFMTAEVIDPAYAGAELVSDISFEDGRGVAGDRAGTGLEIDRDLLTRDDGAGAQ